MNRILNGAVFDGKFIGDNSIICANTVVMKDVEIDSNTIVGPLCILESGVKIGKNVTIQPHSLITRDMTVQDNVFIGPHFTSANDRFIQDGEHGTSPNKKPFTAHKILIKKNTRIGSRCSIAPGVTIGENCYIKMNCFIRSDVPDDMTIAANSDYPIDYEI